MKWRFQKVPLRKLRGSFDPLGVIHAFFNPEISEPTTKRIKPFKRRRGEKLPYSPHLDLRKKGLAVYRLEFDALLG